MEIGNIAEHNKGFRYLLNCIDIYTVCKKQKWKNFLTIKFWAFVTAPVQSSGLAIERLLVRIR